MSGVLSILNQQNLFNPLLPPHHRLSFFRLPRRLSAATPFSSAFERIGKLSSMQLPPLERNTKALVFRSLLQFPSVSVVCPYWQTSAVTCYPCYPCCSSPLHIRLTKKELLQHARWKMRKEERVQRTRCSCSCLRNNEIGII